MAALPIPVTAQRAGACAHCGLPSGSSLFCCSGCEAVHTLLRSEGLLRYYDLGSGNPMTEGAARPDRLWLEAAAGELRDARGLTKVTLDVQGMHCSACVWIFQELFRRHGKPGHVKATPSTGRCELLVDPTFPLESFVDGLSRFGYRFSSAKRGAARPPDELVWRMGVCVAIAMNTMLFAIAIYAGLSEGPLYRLFVGLDFALSSVSVLVGGPIFFRSAWATLRRRAFHLDLPIALGIALAYATSAHGFFTRSGETYFDTLNVFIALMLVGRFLQERVLRQNRAYLLESDGADGLLARRVRDGRVAIVKGRDLRRGDVILLAPGDLVPVEASPLGRAASFSLDWITGEPEPASFAPTERVPAGAFLRQAESVQVRIEQDFEESGLRDLLRAVPEGRAQVAFWQAFARAYVVVVLVLAVGTFAFWAVHAGPWRAFEITSGLLIVTCPCAIGIATPFAYELAHAGLRRAGLFVRAEGFLDRAVAVRRVVFDKTGTLTTGRLVLRDAAPLSTLSAESRSVLYNLAARSSHPKAEAIRAALGDADVTLDDAFVATEEPGRGVRSADAYLGAPLAATPAGAGDVVFVEGGVVRATFETEEVLREGAERDVAALVRDGYDTFVLTGDRADRAREVAARFNIPAERVVAGAGPEAKRAWLEAHDAATTLMIGDGVNDALALESALCSGTPAVDRPFVAARSDFFFTGAGFEGVGRALRVAKHLRRVVHRNIGVAIAYNAITVTLAATGRMSPLLCAVVMPLSSVGLIALTMRELSAQAKIWTS